jgi:hypothetical protein
MLGRYTIEALSIINACRLLKDFAVTERNYGLAAIWSSQSKPVPSRPPEGLTSVFEMGTGKPLHFGRQQYIVPAIYKGNPHMIRL